jgi:hypothetical protein
MEEKIFIISAGKNKTENKKKNADIFLILICVQVAMCVKINMANDMAIILVRFIVSGAE